MSDRNPKTGKSGGELLRPAFETDAQALGFLVLLVFALMLPVLITKSGLISRRDSYRIMPENQGAYSFVEQEIFESERDIDILFIGSSVIWNAVDTPQVEKELGKKLGRPARAVTFGHYFNSIDISYMQLRDLLERKRAPRMVVLSIPRMPFTDGPSTTAYRFIRYSDDPALFGALPLEGQISLYACSVLRAPRDLLTLIREDRTIRSPYAETGGADIAELGMGRDAKKFERFAPSAARKSAYVYSPESEGKFRFTGENLSAYQNLYLEKLIGLLRENEVPFMILNVPQYSEARSAQIIERKNWSKEFGGAGVPLVGISPAELYAGLTADEIERLHYDDEHMNANGSEFFTRAALPAILEVYEKNAAKNH